MSFEGKEFTLRSLCLLVVDCPHATPKWTDSGVVVLRNKNIKGGRLDLSSPSFTDEVHYQGRIRRAAPQGGDIVMTREAPMGEVCEIPHGLRCCVGQRQVLLRPNPKKVHGRFLLFALQSTYLQQQIDWNEGTGSTVSNLRIPVLEALRVPTPSLRDQIEIANTLGALDDRIALLRETNTTLEAIAQALFKSWFVDFDPVRAKLVGRAPEGMDEATAALFPDGLEESALGLLPKTWNVRAIEELCETITNGGTPSRSNETFWTNGTMPWFKTGDFADGFLLAPAERISEGAISKSSVKVLPANAILMAIYAAPTVGRLGILTESATFNQACTGMVARATVGPWFLLLTLYFGRTWFNSRANGAAQQNISKAIVASYRAIVPSEPLLDRFHEIADNLYCCIRANSKQAQTLTTLRDTLLPRLISGQLRLPDAEGLAHAPA